MTDARTGISGIVLTRNEEAHIRRCLRSARRVCDVIHVIDSNSNDRTRAIAEEEGAVVHTGDFTSFAQKLNWVSEEIDFDTPWVMRIDADEVLSSNLVAQLPSFLAQQPGTINGVFVRRRLWFMGRPMRFGGVYPRHSMRLWRPRMARCEVRALDEHMLLSGGTSTTLEVDIDDIPLTDLALWIAKHNEYSTLEARTAAHDRAADSENALQPRFLGNKNERIRWLKEKVFYRMPPFIRPLAYYIYRYFFLLGFLDGKAGFIFHFLHGFWYRFLVDAKLVEARWRNADRSTLPAETSRRLP
ncbi:glycosyltransferase family 2 protein [Sphingomonas sp. LB3N6]|uniref:glycosyltransferase family 2 protein n=1 Tax=Sphingomonas fucosidasi TaxID=3096164 RepID=UPI002FC6E320